jgi:hypothetical protein
MKLYDSHYRKTKESYEADFTTALRNIYSDTYKKYKDDYKYNDYQKKFYLSHIEACIYSFNGLMNNCKTPASEIKKIMKNAISKANYSTLLDTLKDMPLKERSLDRPLAKEKSKFYGFNFLVGFMYSEGLGTKDGLPDYDEAEKHIARVADSDNIAAQNLLNSINEMKKKFSDLDRDSRTAVYILSDEFSKQPPAMIKRTMVGLLENTKNLSPKKESNNTNDAALPATQEKKQEEADVQPVNKRKSLVQPTNITSPAHNGMKFEAIPVDGGMWKKPRMNNDSAEKMIDKPLFTVPYSNNWQSNVQQSRPQNSAYVHNNNSNNTQNFVNTGYSPQQSNAMKILQQKWEQRNSRVCHATNNNNIPSPGNSMDLDFSQQQAAALARLLEKSQAARSQNNNNNAPNTHWQNHTSQQNQQGHSIGFFNK